VFSGHIWIVSVRTPGDWYCGAEVAGECWLRVVGERWTWREGVTLRGGLKRARLGSLRSPIEAVGGGTVLLVSSVAVVVLVRAIPVGLWAVVVVVVVVVAVVAVLITVTSISSSMVLLVSVVSRIVVAVPIVTVSATLLSPSRTIA
jgi:hypothetical protein